MISLWLNPEDHLRTLSLVLERLRFAGFKMNKTKWKFLQQSVVYLGQKLNEEGLQPIDDKLAAIRDAPRAKHVTTFKSFLGLIMYVLFTVHATSFHCTVTSSQSAQEIYPLDVVQNWRRCIVTGFSDISIYLYISILFYLTRLVGNFDPRPLLLLLWQVPNKNSHS